MWARAYSHSRPISFLVHFYFVPGLCKIVTTVSVFSVLFILFAYLRNVIAELKRIFVHIDCDRGSVLLRRRCDMSSTSGTVDDVMISHEPYGAIRKREENSVTAETTALIPTSFCSAMNTGGEVCYLRLPFVLVFSYIA